MNERYDDIEHMSKWRNKKSGETYWIIDSVIINCTNNEDGQLMVLYSKDNKYFVREKNEFKEKFEQIY